MKLEFSRQILKNTDISNFMKIHPVGTELFLADGQTDLTKLIDTSIEHNNLVFLMVIGICFVLHHSLCTC